jgi:glycosyltransferase involved in cell wall biosynthesis
MAERRPNGLSLRRLIVTGLLATLYTGAAWLARCRPRSSTPAIRSGCILVLGTFHNPNWVRSHVVPLARSGVGEVLVVCDEPAEPLDDVFFECPPRWLQAVLTRAAAKLAWSFVLAVRRRPDLFMGYHIFPCALMALILGRVFGRPSCYQMTAGQLEVEGGGWHAENRLLRALDQPSALVERRAAAVIREFDSVVVRGSGAAAYVRKLGYTRNLEVITGSVTPPCASFVFALRPIDIAFVGRLTEYKRPDRFVSAMAAIASERPGLRAVLIGDGPLRGELRDQVLRLGIEANVEFLGQRADVEALLARTKVFMLTSRWEGVSIAMLEAMAAGAVPVVANVGDLGDRLESGCNGYLVAPDDIAGYARAAARLLADAGTWGDCSRRATRLAVETSGTDAIAARWRAHLASVLARNPDTQIVNASGPIR